MFKLPLSFFLAELCCLLRNSSHALNPDPKSILITIGVYGTFLQGGFCMEPVCTFESNYCVHPNGQHSYVTWGGKNLNF